MFKATVEQSQQLTNKFKQQPKADFKLWQQLGLKMLETFEKANLIEYQEIERIADQYHEINKQCKIIFENEIPKT